jgi:hypothetical protein
METILSIEWKILVANNSNRSIIFPPLYIELGTLNFNPRNFLDLVFNVSILED